MEILFFCIGDSAKASTWSNVPYLFSKEIEKRGVVLRRINLAPNPIVNKLYNKLLLPISRLFFPHNVYSYERTSLNMLLTNLKIRKAIIKYPSADYCFFICFHFYNRYSKTPSLLFCDWTYKIYIRERLHRTPNLLERRFIRQEFCAINHALHVISLFPECAQMMKVDCPQASISHFRGNVVNSFYEGQLPDMDQFNKKKTNNKILFIGNSKYREAAIKTIAALDYLDDSVTLDIIGMTSDEVGITCPRVIYHGYLRKDIDSEKDKYYKLLLEASIVTNTTPQWGGYSSIIEAMYFYTPILVSPFKDFVKEFGEDISFGKYCKDFTPESIACNIKLILNNFQYNKMCIKAHDTVKEYTWENYTNQIFELINKNEGYTH